MAYLKRWKECCKEVIALTQISGGFTDEESYRPCNNPIMRSYDENLKIVRHFDRTPLYSLDKMYSYDSGHASVWEEALLRLPDTIKDSPRPASNYRSSPVADYATNDRETRRSRDRHLNTSRPRPRSRSPLMSRSNPYSRKDRTDVFAHTLGSRSRSKTMDSKRPYLSNCADESRQNNKIRDKTTRQDNKEKHWENTRHRRVQQIQLAQWFITDLHTQKS